MCESGVPLRAIVAHVAAAGHVAKRDAITRHRRNHAVVDDTATENRAMAMALRRVLPSLPDVIKAMAEEVEREGADELGSAIRDLARLHQPAPEPEPTEQQPTEQQPTEQQPTEQQPTEQQPTEQQPTEQQPENEGAAVLPEPHPDRPSTAGEPVRVLTTATEDATS